MFILRLYRLSSQEAVCLFVASRLAVLKTMLRIADNCLYGNSHGYI